MTYLDLFKRDPVKKGELALYLAIASFLFLIGSYFSVGFHHFDEHFQILEFANLKLGGTAGADLPTEYHQQMRPWLQPAISFAFSKFFFSLGIESPFVHAWLLRILTGLFALVTLYYLGAYLMVRYKNVNQRALLCSLFFTWFIPYVSIRFSSDTWGALSILLLGALLLLQYPSSAFKGRWKLSWWAVPLLGIGFGLSFQLRYMEGALIFFFFLWLLLFGRFSLSQGIVMTIFLVLSLGIGIGIDSWGYENSQGIVFAPWRYLDVNLFKGYAASIGREPWYEYFRLSFNRGIPPFSLALMIGVFAYWYQHPKSALTWMTLPYFLVHQFTAHKELRFLMPLFYLAGPMCVITCYHLVSKKWWRWGFRLNFLILVATLLKPANSGVAFYPHFRELDPHTIVGYRGENPFSMVGKPLRFYQSSGLELEEDEDFLFPHQFTRDYKEWQELKARQCELLASAYPEALLKIEIGKWRERSRLWALWKCR